MLPDSRFNELTIPDWASVGAICCVAPISEAESQISDKRSYP